jgi:hypothetical protein
MIILAKISAACALVLPFLGAVYQLITAYTHRVGKRPWAAAGAVALAVFLTYLGWTKL